MAAGTESSIANTLRTVSAASSVLQATTTALARTKDRHPTKDSTVAYLSAASSTVSLEALPTCPSPGSGAVCHMCAMDPCQGIWGLASARENGNCVLMALKGSLSKHKMLLERMCIYRMAIPPAFSVAVPPHIRERLFPPLPSRGPVSIEASVERMKVCSGYVDRIDKVERVVTAVDTAAHIRCDLSTGFYMLSQRTH
jgi:hypothetical protein